MFLAKRRGLDCVHSQLHEICMLIESIPGHGTSHDADARICTTDGKKGGPSLTKNASIRSGMLSWGYETSCRPDYEAVPFRFLHTGRLRKW